MSKESVRFDNDFARHKALDVIGDLMLCGKRILGHVICVKPGHGPNTQLAATLKKEYSRMRSLAAPFEIPQGEAILDINDIMKLLPHRHPFLLVDRIVDFEGDNKCTGLKNVTMNEPFFPGHFPEHPIMPGVLIIEAFVQTAMAVCASAERRASGAPPASGMLAKVTSLAAPIDFAFLVR